MSEPRSVSPGALPIAVLTGVLATALAFPLSTKLMARDPAALTQANQDTASSIEAAFTQIADTLGPATVSISAVSEVTPSPMEQLFPGAPRRPRRETPGGEPSDEPVLRPIGGSGVIVRADGYIVTNDHVVEKAREGKVRVKLASGESYTGTVYRDQRSDLAVIKINPEKPLPTVKFADSDALKVGQWAIAIGSPFGQDNSVTAGIVSALHRKSTIGGAINGRYYPELIQTDASINPGNSGGPLFNIRGELIGVNVAIDSPTGGSVGIGFAIPANTAKLIVDQLVAKGKVTRGYLGIKPTDVEPEVRKALGVERGAYVAEVTGDGPADAAGIDPGDVVVRFNDRDVRDEASLRYAIATAKPGSTVPISLLRAGKPLTLTAKLEELKEEVVATAKPLTRKPTESSDFEVEPITAENREDLNLPESVKGVVVTRVKVGTPAQEAGLGRGLVIVSLNGKPVSTPEDVKAAIKAVPSGRVIMVQALLPNARPGAKPSRAAYNIEVP